MKTLALTIVLFILTGCGRAIVDKYDRFTGNLIFHAEVNTLFKNIAFDGYTGESVPIKAIIPPIGAIESGGGE